MTALGFLIAIGPALVLLLGFVILWLTARHHEHYVDDVEKHRSGHA